MTERLIQTSAQISRLPDLARLAHRGSHDQEARILMDRAQNMDWKNCSEVKVRAEYVHGAPTVGDSRVPVETIENGYELGQTPEELAADYDLPLEPIRAIFAHIRNHEHAPSR